MPGGDRTGPFGLGPRTGRGAGLCGGFGRPGFMNWSFYGGRMRGVGRGRVFFRGPAMGGFRQFFHGRGPVRAAWRGFGPWWDHDPRW